MVANTGGALGGLAGNLCVGGRVHMGTAEETPARLQLPASFAVRCHLATRCERKLSIQWEQNANVPCLSLAQKTFVFMPPQVLSPANDSEALKQGRTVR